MRRLWAVPLVMILPSLAQAQAGIPYAAPPDEGDTEEAATPAADDATKGEAKLESSVATEPAAPVPSVDTAPPPPPPPTDTVIAQLWETRRLALAAGSLQGADAALRELVVVKDQAGWPNIFAYGEALARESEQATTKGNVGRGVELAQAAVLVAPDLPQPHVVLARALWAQGDHVLAAVSAGLDGYLETWIEAPYLRARLGLVLNASVAVVVLATLLFALMALYRHARMMVHDFHHLLPHGATRLQSGLFGVLFLLTPLFFRIGILPTLVAWIALMGLYYERRERIAALVLLLALAGAAVLLPRVTSLMSYSGTRSEAIYLATRDMLAEDAALRLEASTDPRAEDLYALGLRARWKGDLRRAVDLLSRAERVGASDARLYVDLGNLKYLLGDKQAAIAYYNRALSVDADSVVALFNMSRVYYSLAEQQKAGEAHRRATAVDYELVEAFARDAKRVGPTYLVNAGVPRSLLVVPQPADALHERAVSQLWLWFASRSVPRFVFATGALAALLLLAVMAWLRGAAKPSVACPRCGMAACKRCNPEMPDQKQCGQCYHAFVVREGVDPQSRIRKEIEVHRHQARTLRVRQVLSLTLTGTAQLAGGAALRGISLFALFAAGVLGLVLALDLVPTPAPVMARALSIPSAVVMGVVVITAFVLGLYDAKRKEH
ncbi:MAG: tetratricopeptide repeat protein [Deltaproteobacteria bacterium]|nr:tetratricopeptide repeat protein [Deltaproteobacteria bacterium]